MAIDTQLVEALIQETGETVRNLHGEELSDLQPAEVPLIVVSRLSVFWGEFDTYCGQQEAEATYSVDCLSLSLEDARRLSNLARRVLTNLGFQIESLFDVWESSMKIYRVTLTASIIEENF